MKKEATLILISVILINFASAATFSLGTIFDQIDPQTLVLTAIFMILFAAFYFSTSRIFGNKQKDQFYGTQHHEPNKAVAFVISFCFSLLIVYWLYKQNLDFQGFAYNSMGMDQALFNTIIPIIVLAGLVFLIFKLKKKLLLLLGLFFIALSLTGIMYENGIILLIGIGFLAIWLIWTLISRQIKKKKNNPFTGRVEPPPSDQYKKRWGEEKLRREEAERQKEKAEAQTDRQKQLRRNLYDLKNKYMAYLFRYNQRGQKAYQRQQIIKAMYIILEYAKRCGVSESQFLSSSIGGSNAKHPSQLRPPYDG
jgi:hypothetical protein